MMQVNFPYTLTQQVASQSIELKVDELKVNTEISDEVFKIK